MGRRCLLAYSRGKDALASLLRLRRHFDAITCYYMDLVPGLSFVEESLAYQRKKLGITIHVFQHPATVRMLRESVFQPPDRAAALRRTQLPTLKVDDIQEAAGEVAGDESLFAAIGLRRCDGYMRRLTIDKHGAVNNRKRTFFPVFDLTVAQVRESLAAEGIALPDDYRMFGRTFDGINAQYLIPIKRDYPADYARVLDVFPLADIEVWRAERWARK
jgi:3'-phosphoadenosine 5'-phosphosulfate sulfotransferase (PAPS reductase)/FAD synthetase